MKILERELQNDLFFTAENAEIAEIFYCSLRALRSLR